MVLADNVVFHELPFGGVLLDRSKLNVYRLSQRGAAVLRRELYGERTVSPYESVLPAEKGDPAVRHNVLHALMSCGLIRVVAGDG